MRQTRREAIVVLFAIATSVGLAACGYSIAGSGASPDPTRTLTPGSCPNPTTGAALSQPGSEPVSRAQLAAPVTTLPPGVTIGQVMVVLDADNGYSPSSTIIVWAGNGLSQCIYSTDHHSDCSIVVLERRVNGNWQPQANCLRASPTQIIVLPPTQADFLQLPPEASGAHPGVWPTGTYRVAFSYWLEREGTGQPVEVDTEPFAVM